MNFEEYMNNELEHEIDCEEECEGSRPYECFEIKPCECGHHHNDGCLEDEVDMSCICKPVCKKLPVHGKLKVYVNLNCVDGEPISGLSISLYKNDNGCEKKLITKKTDKNGYVEFTCLEEGLYQVEQDIDPCIFECAEFYPANQFCITKKTKCQKIHIINKLKKVDPCLLKLIDKAAERAVRKALCKCRRRCC